MNRALRAATMGVLLLSPIALTACSAGQVTQTATQERDKTGGQAQVGSLTVRQAALESPREGFGEAEIDADGQDEIEIPAGESVFVSSDADAQITLTNLDEGLTAGQYLTLTLTFENAGDVDVRVSVANPDEALDREEAYDFHQEEGDTSGETAREEESSDSE